MSGFTKFFANRYKIHKSLKYRVINQNTIASVKNVRYLIILIILG